MICRNGRITEHFVVFCVHAIEGRGQGLFGKNKPTLLLNLMSLLQILFFFFCIFWQIKHRMM